MDLKCEGWPYSFKIHKVDVSLLGDTPAEADPGFSAKGTNPPGDMRFF